MHINEKDASDRLAEAVARADRAEAECDKALTELALAADVLRAAEEWRDKGGVDPIWSLLQAIDALRAGRPAPG